MLSLNGFKVGTVLKRSHHSPVPCWYLITAGSQGGEFWKRNLGTSFLKRHSTDNCTKHHLPQPYNQDELSQAQIFLMCFQDQHIVDFGAEADVLSHRGSLSSLAVFFLPANKIALQQRDERIPVPKSHFKKGKQASLNVELPRRPLGAVQDSVTGSTRAEGRTGTRAPCLDGGHQELLAPRPVQSGRGLRGGQASGWGGCSLLGADPPAGRWVTILGETLKAVPPLLSPGP